MNVEKPDIKIFVSHRIDLDSETIDNPLYINVRCGAVYDEREGVSILGDDTGDNISKKRESFCELTVMYWAWKNFEADYYGLCHYRRYISFAEKSYQPENDKSGYLAHPYLDAEAIDKYCLNESSMRNIIEKYDVITTPAEEVFYDCDGKHKSVYQLCIDRKRDFDIDGVDELIKLVKQKYPKYAQDTDDYFNDNCAKFYNCFVMKRNLFNELCVFVFDILFELDKKLDKSKYNVWKMRMPGMMAEHLIGIFYLHIKRKAIYKILEKDLVLFLETTRMQKLLPAFSTNNIPIVFSSSDYFSPIACVAIQSILENKSDKYNYDILILESKISKINKSLLSGLALNSNNVSIRFYNPKPLIKNSKFYINSKDQSEEAYYRMLVPYILVNYKKAIVLDCDLIAKCDIADLYNIDLENCFAGIVPDVVYHGYYMGLSKEIIEYCAKEFPMRNPENYVNT